MIHTGGSSFTCGNALGCAVTGIDGATFAFTPKPGLAGDSTGVILINTAFDVYDSGNSPTAIAEFQGDNYINIQVETGGNRDDTTPEPIGAVSAGRTLYGQNPTTLELIFAGFISASTGGNGNPLRIRANFIHDTPGLNTPANLAQVNTIQAGWAVYLGPVGDDGTITSTGEPGQPAATTATSFSLHGAQTGYIAEGDTITTSAAFSTF